MAIQPGTYHLRLQIIRISWEYINAQRTTNLKLLPNHSKINSIPMVSNIHITVKRNMSPGY